MNTLDKVIGWLSPESAVKRMMAREVLKRQYAAAKTTRLTGSWSPAPSSVNELIGSSAPAVRERVRQLVRDFPYFSRAVNVMCDYTVGSGIQFQARTKGRDGRHDPALIQKIEDAFARWADEADASGRLSYYEMMNLAKRQDIEQGEFFLVRTYLNDKKRFLPLAYQMYETDWLSDINAKASNPDHWIDQGVEYDIYTGQIKAYHLSATSYKDNMLAPVGTSTRIPADRVIHGFQTLRPMQLRGISPFASAVLVAHDLSDYMDAEIDAAKLAAKYLAFVKTGDAYGRQMGLTSDDEGKPIENMENAIIEYLRPGEEIQIATNPKPGNNFPPFVRLVLCMISVATGVPYELLSGDNTGLNFSTAKIIRTDFATALKPTIERHIRQFCRPTAWDFLDAAVLTGKLDLPGYVANPWPYREIVWQPPGMQPVDPLRETKANIEEMTAGLRSPQEIAQARGRDLEEIYKEIDAAKKLAEEMGLEFGTPSTAMANNPAAINNEEPMT